MSKNRHTEAQMIGALKQLAAGRKAEDVAWEVGVRVCYSDEAAEAGSALLALPSSTANPESESAI
jgi:hypothetical protein